MFHTLPWSVYALPSRAIAPVLFVSGAIGALALPPFDLWPLIAVPLSAFAILLQSDLPLGRFAWRAFLIGFGYFVAGLWWLGVAFFVEPDQFAWALPLGVLGLPAVLACFPLAGMIAAQLISRTGISKFFALIIGLGGAEYLRSFLFTGFPWNSFGVTLASNVPLSQMASLLGQNGLDLLVIAIFSSPGFFIVSRKRREPLMAVALLVACFCFGEWRLSNAREAHVPDVRLRIMQPDMPLDDRFSGRYAAEIMQSYLTLSTKGSYPSQDGMAGITHLIWPETSFPFLIEDAPLARAQIASILPANGALITGAVRRERDASGKSRFFNAIMVLDQKGSIVVHADKVHLVPFGEYLPFADWLEKLGIRQFVSAPGGFNAGPERVMLNAPGLPPFGPLVCYEAIFSNAVLPNSPSRPGLLLNVTNDGWFGITPGPSQHFALARLRAIEEGLPLVRAANNGISAVVDAYGRVEKRLALGEKGVLDADLPAAIDQPLFTRLPYLVWILMLMAISLEALLNLTQRQLTRNAI